MRFSPLVVLPTLLMCACSPNPSSNPNANPTPAPSASSNTSNTTASGVIWNEQELESTLTCLEGSGDAVAKAFAGQIRYGFENQKRSKSYPNFNQATFDSTINTYGNSLSNFKSMGTITGSAADCIQK